MKSIFFLSVLFFSVFFNVSCLREKEDMIVDPEVVAKAQRIDAIKILIENGNVSQAQETLDQAFVDGVQHPMAFYLQGLIHFNLDTREGHVLSIPWFEKSIGASPQWLEPRLFLARACLKDERLQRAAQVFAEIDSLAPHSSVGPYGLALIDSMNGKTKKAIVHCDQALVRNQWSQAALLLRARLAARENDMDAQRHYYQRLVSIDPLQAEAHFALGEISLSSGRLADAQRSFLRSYDLHPRSQTARQLADLAVQRNDENARQLWLKRAGAQNANTNEDFIDIIDNDNIE